MCNAIMAGRTTSLDGSSHGLLFVMQELNSKPNRREPRGLLTSVGEGELGKRMFNFAPYGECLRQSSGVLFPIAKEKFTVECRKYSGFAFVGRTGHCNWLRKPAPSS